MALIFMELNNKGKRKKKKAKERAGLHKFRVNDKMFRIADDITLNQRCP